MTSIIENPIKFDAATGSKMRLNYARILVEVTSESELPNEIFLTMYNGEDITQKVEYEWISPKYDVCVFWTQRRNAAQKKLEYQKRVIKLIKNHK